MWKFNNQYLYVYNSEGSNAETYAFKRAMITQSLFAFEKLSAKRAKWLSNEEHISLDANKCELQQKASLIELEKFFFST